MSHHYSSPVLIPDNTPRIGLCVRLIDGVPVLFTDQGHFVRGQVKVVVTAGVDESTQATATVNLVRGEP